MKNFLLKTWLMLVMMLVGAGTSWAEDFNTTYSYGLSGWSLTNYTDQSSYYQVPTGTGVTTSVATISGIFSGKTITGNVVVTINCATYGNGTNPSASTFSLYKETACTNAITAAQGGTLPTSSTYTDVTYTITQANAASLGNDLAIKITKPGKTIRLKSIKVAFTYTTSGGGDTPTTKYDVTVANDLTGGTISANPVSAAEGDKVTLTATPADGYEFESWSVTNASTSESIAVTNNQFTMPAANVNVSATFSVVSGTTVTMTSFSAISGNVGGDVNVSYEAAQGSASTAPVESGGEIRVYQNGGLFTVSANNGTTITEVIIGSSMATTVTYAVDGGSTSSNRNIAAGNKLTVSSINASNNVVFTCKGTDKNSRLYVNYLKVTYTLPTLESYTVTFNAGVNGTCSTASLKESAVGAGIILPAVTPNAGFTFAGWSTDVTPSSANAGVAGDTYHPLKNCTLYAYYTISRPAGEVFYESFDTNEGTGGNDNQWSGSIASSDIKSDNNSWTFEKGSGAKNCAKFGTGSLLGSAQTPAIAASGNFVLTFKAAAWNGNSESTTLKLSATDATLSASSVTLTKGAWNTYNVNITNATEGFKIKFEGKTASNSRFFLDEISVVAAPEPEFTEYVLEFVATDGSSYWATFSSSKDVFVDEDAMPYAVTVSGKTLILDDDAFKADDIEIDGTPVSGYWIPANTGVLLQSSSNEVFYWTVENVNVDAISKDNLLRPASATKEADGSFKFYKLAYASSDLDGLGFYWGAAEGGVFSSREGSAYLAVPTVSDQSLISGFTFGDDDETAICSMKANENVSGEFFNVAGQKVSKNYKGIIVVNGKKMLNK